MGLDGKFGAVRFKKNGCGGCWGLCKKECADQQRQREQKNLDHREKDEWFDPLSAITSLIEYPIAVKGTYPIKYGVACFFST